jgi:drug/metabolite transporter (DMT)-like permease
LSPLLALGASVAYGVADFAGTLATRRSSALTVAISVQAVGFLLLAPLAPLLPGEVTLDVLLLGAAAGVMGTGGLVIYLGGMAVGPIGVVSPLAAVTGAAVPVLWGAWLLGERLGTAQVGGVVLALASVVAVAWVPGTTLRSAHLTPVLQALLGGTLFGGFFIVLALTPASSGIWPLVGARIATGAVAYPLLRLVARPAPLGPARRHVLLSGLTDTTANVLFVLAARGGLLSVSALLSSLYPVVALLLARQVLRERLGRLQITGVAAALVATGLLVAG